MTGTRVRGTHGRKSAPARASVGTPVMVSVAGRRPENEDVAEVEKLSDGRVLLLVADGMGGARAGALAARTAASAFLKAARQQKGDPRRILMEGFHAAWAAVKAESGKPENQGMGSTLVAALVEPSRVTVLHVGDSRALLLLPNGAHQLTEDHTMVAEAQRRGEMTEAEALSHPFRRAIVRALDGSDVEPDVQQFPLHQGPAARATVLLCSDGLCGVVGETEMIEDVNDSPDLEAGLNRLVMRALRNGSDDNVTVAAVALGGDRSRGRVKQVRPGVGVLVLAVTFVAALGLIGYQYSADRSAAALSRSSAPVPASTRARLQTPSQAEEAATPPLSVESPQSGPSGGRSAHAATDSDEESTADKRDDDAPVTVNPIRPPADRAQINPRTVAPTLPPVEPLPATLPVPATQRPLIQYAPSPSPSPSLSPSPTPDPKKTRDPKKPKSKGKGRSGLPVPSPAVEP